MQAIASLGPSSFALQVELCAVASALYATEDSRRTAVIQVLEYYLDHSLEPVKLQVCRRGRPLTTDGTASVKVGLVSTYVCMSVNIPHGILLR
jgi:hypothetical protein